MTTLETAIRQIDRESRELLQQTFDTVNENFAQAVPDALRRRPGEARADRRGDPRLGRAGRRAAAGQAQHVHSPAVGRREGAHRDLAGVRAVPAQSGAVLPAGRSRRAARRPEHRPLLPDGAGHGGETQFLFISHNKITMEMANQLVGITMPEPGVFARRGGRHRRSAGARASGYRSCADVSARS